MTAKGVAGITEEQLGALTAGCWVDDISVSPGWERWVIVDGVEDDVRQWIYLSVYRPGQWTANSDENSAWVGTLEEALKWCDEWADDVLPTEGTGTATKQTNRFPVRSVSG